MIAGLAVMALGAPVSAASTLASKAVGNRSQTSVVGFWSAFGAASGAHLAVSAGAVLLGASARNWSSVALLTLVDALALSTSATFTMDALGEPRVPTALPMLAGTPPAFGPTALMLPLLSGVF